MTPGRLVDYPAALNSQWRPVYHLQDYAEELEGALTEAKRVLCAVPIQHHKTTTNRCAIAWWLVQNPKLHIIYLTHTFAYAEALGRQIRDTSAAAGVKIKSGYNTIRDWSTEQGGGVFVMSNDQTALGRPVDILMFDDPYAGAEDAYQVTVRDRIDYIIGFYESRLQRGGSVFGIMSRFDPDDAIGRRLDRPGWKYIHHRAIEGDGTPDEREFCADIMTLAELKAKRASLTNVDPLELVWWSQFQNEPIAGKSSVFRGVTNWSKCLPTEQATIGIGVDAAFSVGAHADFFSAVVDGFCGDKHHILDVVRHQRGTDGMVSSLLELRRTWPTARMFAYVSGPEIGVYHMLFRMGVDIETIPAKWSKEFRARPAAHAWSTGRILVPTDQSWSARYLREHHSFTGLGQEQDDQVDATVSVFDAIESCKPAEGFGSTFTYGRACM